MSTIIRSLFRLTPVILSALLLSVSPAPVEKVSAQVPAAIEDTHNEEDTSRVEPTLSEEDLARIDELSKLIRSARLEGVHGDAIRPAEEILAIRQRVQGSAHWKTRYAEKRLAYFRFAAALPQHQQDELAEAYAIASERGVKHIWRDSTRLDRERMVCEIYRRILGDDHFLTLLARSDLGNTLWYYGYMEEAEQCLRQAQDGLRRVLGDDHSDTQWNVTRLIALLRDMGRLDEAERIGRTCLEATRQLLGADHWETHYIMAWLGMVLLDQGRLAEAEVLLLDEFECFRRVQAAGGSATSGKSTMNYFMHFALFDVCDMLYRQGRLIEAEELLREGRQEFIQTIGPDDVYAHYYSFYLARLMLELGRFDQSETLFREALAGIEPLMGADSQKTLRVASGLAELLMKQARYAEAETLLLETRDHYDASPLKGNREALQTVARLGRLRLGQGRLAEAETMYRRALEGQRRILGPQHPDVVDSLSALALIKTLLGQKTEAETFWRDAAAGFDSARLRAGLGGLDRVHFTARRSPLPALAACLAGAGRPCEAWQQMETNLARGLLDTLSARHVRPLTSGERQQETELNSRLIGIDEQMSALRRALDGAEGDSTELSRLSRERVALQVDLASFEVEISRKYGVAAGDVLSLPRIQSHLEPDAAIVGWLDVETEPLGQPLESHWACVVRSGGEPVWIELPGTGEGGAWTAADRDLAGRVRETLRTRALGGSDRGRAALCQRLYLQRFQPVEKLLRDVRQLVVLPAGQMAGVPVETLAAGYTVSYAPSGTMFAWLGTRGGHPGDPSERKRATSLLALGDPVFRKGGGTRDSSPLAGGESALEEIAGRIRGPSYCPLPQSRHEVQAIGRLFKTTDNDNSQLILLGSEASEQRLERLASSGELRKFNYLHFATHAVMDDRMAMRSALILSRDQLPDSTERVLQQKEVYDGRLTGEQIVRTWRLNADLVVFSGCDTALGVESGGEGYLGFSQALFVAGARSLLLSLWPVDDRATRLLMSRFYENCLGAFSDIRHVGVHTYDPGLPMPRAEALHEAKKWLRELTFQKLHQLHQPESGDDDEIVRSPQEGAAQAAAPPSHPYSDPHYWAAFILLGAP